ncbi:MAG TPA: O-antigen ligase family protein [Bryobacteraceae bacterium]|nr:O-antigen ligase family protein [Bryobacteraceae bacterium]
MNSRAEDIPAWLAGAAAVCAVVSIAAMEILMGAAIVALIARRTRWQFPPVWQPLAAFVILTLVALLADGHAREGWPLIKKLSLYSMLFLIPTAIKRMEQVRWMVMGWALAAALSALLGLNQFYNKYEDAMEDHRDFYRAYVADRITGFMGHWMTFSGHMMMALLLIAALVFFGKGSRWRWWLVAAGAVIAIALVAAETRSVWLATAVGGAYLLWFWKKWTLIAAPVAIALVVMANPFEIGDRVISAIQPHGTLDSNEHRAITRAIGYQMMKAHPWLGIGPERVGKEYLNYLPPGTPKQLPDGYYQHLHNNFIHYSAELGIPAGLALMAIFARALWDFARALIGGPGERRWIFHGAIAVTIAMMIAGLYEKNLGDSEVLAMLLATIGCGYVGIREVQTCKD